jgi:3-phosphoshikimate 1-carboxyvinyltransferase
MIYSVYPSKLGGETIIPSSKPNSIRGVLVGSLTSGKSILKNPLRARDPLSMVSVCEKLGAKVELFEDRWEIDGFGRMPKIPNDILYVGNSGTTYYLITGVACLNPTGSTIISGDHQIRRRPCGPLIDAINALGANIYSTRNNGLAPLVARGRIRGGTAYMPGINSQWFSSLVLSCPLADGRTEIFTANLTESPYVRHSLSWLDRSGIDYEINEDLTYFNIPGGQEYQPFEVTLPGDWGSANFLMVAAAISDSDLTLYGLDTRDVHGDKVIVDILQEMGADVEVKNHGLDGITVRGGKKLHGIDIDCTNIPDSPPILATLGCYAEGKTMLYNLTSSRLKETDRPKVIREELIKMGARIDPITEAQTLTIYESDLKGANIADRNDHRIVMATAIAALGAKGKTTIQGAEWSSISFPGFFEVLEKLGAKLEKIEDI